MDNFSLNIGKQEVLLRQGKGGSFRGWIPKNIGFWEILWLFFTFAALSVVLAGVYAGYVKLCDLNSALQLNVRTLDSDCTDNNVCTLDYAVANGCENIRLADGTDCVGSVCYVPDTTTCQQGQCEGTCLGTCSNVTTCDDLFNATFVTGEDSFTSFCADTTATEGHDTCYWNAVDINIPGYLGNCAELSGNPAIFTQFCLDSVSNDLGFKECLHATPICASSNSTLLTCNYVFRCGLSDTALSSSSSLLNFLNIEL